MEMTAQLWLRIVAAEGLGCINQQECQAGNLWCQLEWAKGWVDRAPPVEVRKPDGDPHVPPNLCGQSQDYPGKMALGLPQPRGPQQAKTPDPGLEHGHDS